MVAGLDDTSAASAWSGRIDVHSENPAGMLGELAKNTPRRPRDEPLPFLRFTLCFVGFFVLDAAIYWLVAPRWNAAVETNRQKAAAIDQQQTRMRLTAPATTAVVKQKPGELVHPASTLADGLRCAGGIVYKSKNIAGVKVITVLMDSGKAVRCR